MDTYSHDYSLATKAEHHLYNAQWQMSQGSIDQARQSLNLARLLLQRYINQDNMVVDNDVYPGWIRATDLQNKDQERVDE